MAETHGPSSQTDHDAGTPTPPRSRVQGAATGFEGHRLRVEDATIYTVMVVWDHAPFSITDESAQWPEQVGRKPAAGVRLLGSYDD